MTVDRRALLGTVYVLLSTILAAAFFSAVAARADVPAQAAWPFVTMPVDAWRAVAPQPSADEEFETVVDTPHEIGQPQDTGAWKLRRFKLAAIGDGEAAVTVSLSDTASTGTLYLIGHLHNPIFYRSQNFRFRLTCNKPAICTIDGKPLGDAWQDGVLTAERSSAAMNHGISRVVIAVPAAGETIFKLEMSEPGDVRFFAGVPSQMDPSLHIDDYRTVHISNGLVTADVAVPDPVRGYYRAGRFEPAGLILQLKYRGHTFFYGGVPDHNPLDPNRGVGPCEEFFKAIAWDDAKPGEPFIKIGVGLYEKPDDVEHKWYYSYWPVRIVPWSIHVRKDAVEFVQDLRGPRGWGYRYVKRLVLVPGQPVLRIEHEFTNTGKHEIDAEQYNHNWACFDGNAGSNGYRFHFPFAPEVGGRLAAGVDVSGDDISISPSTVGNIAIKGYSSSTEDNSVLVACDKTLTQLRISGDFPLSNAGIYFDPTVVCFEPFYAFHLAPGQRTAWTRTYTFIAGNEAGLAPQPE